MKACHCSTDANGVRWWPLLFLSCLALTLVLPGCGMGRGAPVSEGRQAIEGVAKWYQIYRTRHFGKVPPDEDAFFEFIEAELAERGETVDRDEVLTSPRDGQRYVIVYGEPASNNSEQNVAVYEREGYKGKKLVGLESGAYVGSREVDDAELESLLAGD